LEMYARSLSQKWFADGRWLSGPTLQSNVRQQIEIHMLGHFLILPLKLHHYESDFGV